MKPVYVLCAEFKRAVTLHLVTAFFLFGKDGQAVRRYPESCHPAFIWFSVLAKPISPRPDHNPLPEDEFLSCSEHGATTVSRR